MTRLARDRFGFRRVYYDPDGDTVGDSIRGVIQSKAFARTQVAAGDNSRPRSMQPDVPAISGFLDHARLPGRTVLQAVRAVPAGHSLHAGIVTPLPPPDLPEGDLDSLLRATLQRALQSGRRLALALSGGLDSALLLALLHDMGARDVPVYVLVTGLPDYCERDTAIDMADRLGVSVREVRVSPADFVAALPAAARAVEEPMFNLHPVAKLLLARAMAADGIDIAISGDGADQVVRRDTSANYLPLCNALFGAAGVQLLPPFVDDDVVAHLLHQPADSDKPALRALASRLGLPVRLVRGPKHSRLAPAMDLGDLCLAADVHDLARALDLPAPDLRQDAAHVQWATLRLTLDHLGALPA